MATLLVIDNYDSFTYNLVQMFMHYDLAVQVHRSDRISLAQVAGEVDRALSQMLPEPEGEGPEATLFEAMRYATLDGGKRLRPFLVVATARLFEVPDPLPRAYLVSDWEQARSPGAALSRTLEAGFPLGKTVVLEESPQADLLGGTGQVLEADYRLNQIRLKTRTTGPMVLVVNDRHYPGWKARVNGVDVPMLRAGGIFRAVVVPQGDTQVEFIFRPSRLLPGALLSILGLLALAGLSLSYRNRTTTGANPSASGQIP